jgi:hypothetical protein
MFEPGDEAVSFMMHSLESRLWIQGFGGMSRYEGDYYHAVSDDLARGPPFRGGTFPILGRRNRAVYFGSQPMPQNLSYCKKY